MVEGKTHRQMREEVLRILQERGFETENEVPLYIEYQKPFSARHVSNADIVAKKGDQILLVEVEDTEDPSPKLVIGDIGTTNLASECRFKGEPLRLGNVRLFIVTKEFKEKSKKERQLSIILEHLKLGDGCLKDFNVCPIGRFEGKLEELEGLEIRKLKVKIIPPHLWPRLFQPPGVYDIPQDKIYIKGGLPKTSYHQILEHETAHREWFLKHHRIRKGTILLFGKPALYYIISILTTIAFLCSAPLRWESLVLLYIPLSMFHVVFEIPAWMATGFLIKVESVKKTLQSVGMIFLMWMAPFLLMALGVWFFGLITAPVFWGLGLFVDWIFIIYFFLGTLVILRRNSSRD